MGRLHLPRADPDSSASRQGRAIRCSGRSVARRLCFALGAAVACAAAQSSAAEQAAAAQWTYAASEHFEIYTTATSRRAREALTYFEQVHAFFADFLRPSPKAGPRTRLIVFSNEREFRPYRLNDFAVAFYHQGHDRDYIVMEQFGDEAYPVVVHEYAHLVMSHSGRRYPLWLSEGYADFLSTLSPSSGRMVIGGAPEGRLWSWRSGDRMFDLERLFAITHDSPEYRTENHAGLFYAQSWALTHMLVTDARYRTSFDRFVTMVGEGAASEAALPSAFGRSMAEVERDLARYVQRQRFGVLTVHYEAAPTPMPFEEHAVTALEAGLVGANLLASARGAQDRARAAFGALEQEHASDLSLVEARALFELRHGQGDVARPYLARAVALGSTNARIYRAYARLPGTEPMAAEVLFRRALDLQPDDLESRIRLASLFLDRKQAAETLAVLAPVRVVPREHAFDVVHLRAHAYLELKDGYAAREAAIEAQAAAANDEQRDYSMRLLRNIDDFLTNHTAIAAILANRARANAARASATDESEAVRTARAMAADPANSRVSLDGHALLFATGRLRMVICSAPPAIEVDAPEGSLTLVIDAPKMIRVFGTGTTEADLTCGWHDRPIRVGYYRPIRAGKASGNVRMLDYR